MKISLKGKFKDQSEVDLSVEGTPTEMSDVISKPLEAIGTAAIPLVLEKLTGLFDKPNNDLREKLQKEDKRLELAIPKLKKMQDGIYKEIEEVNKRQAYNIGSEGQKVMELNKLRNKYDSIGDELNSIHARRKQIKWALSEPDKK